MVLRTHKTDVNGGLTMEENLYKKLKSVGASNGARLLAHRSDSLF